MSVKTLEGEDQIIQDAKNNNNRAFDKLISHYSDYIWNIASMYTNSREDTEEVYQDAVLKIWLSMKSFRGDSKFSTWIFIIVRRFSSNFLKNKRRIPSHPDNRSYTTSIYDNNVSSGDEDREHELDSHWHTEDTPESIKNSEQLAELVFEAAEKLNEDLAVVWFLREIELLSYEEISDQLDIPLGTCKSRLFNARELLADKLSDYVSKNGKNRFCSTGE